jgi:mycothiol synthase
MTANPQSGVRFRARPCTGDADFMRVRDLLIDAYRSETWDHNWEVRRWEGWRCWHNVPGDDAEEGGDWTAQVCLWEAEDGTLIGAVHPEGPGFIALQVHPDARSRALENAMLEWAEANLSVPTEDGQRRVRLSVPEYDTERQALLLERGYVKTENYGYNRRRRFDLPLPDVPPVEGYRVRSLREGDLGDAGRWADVIRAVFKHANPSAETYHVFQTTSPSYRCDLHLVAEAPDGSFAAFCGITWVPTLRVGIFEPVGTHPDHRRKGLQVALMGEGLRRLQALGAVEALVGTGDMAPANRLYEAMGFTDAHIDYLWQKVF